jgi:hypothetical protein
MCSRGDLRKINQIDNKETAIFIQVDDKNKVFIIGIMNLFLLSQNVTKFPLTRSL